MPSATPRDLKMLAAIKEDVPVGVRALACASEQVKAATLVRAEIATRLLEPLQKLARRCLRAEIERLQKWGDPQHEQTDFTYRLWAAVKGPAMLRESERTDLQELSDLADGWYDQLDNETLEFRPMEEWLQQHAAWAREA